MSGVVIDARVFARKGAEKDERSRQIEDTERAKFEKDMADEIKIIKESAYARVRNLLLGRTTTAKLVDDKGKVLLAKGVALNAEDLDPIIRKYWGHIEVDQISPKSMRFWLSLMNKPLLLNDSFKRRSISLVRVMNFHPV